jgi:hypothetical protein
MEGKKKKKIGRPKEKVFDRIKKRLTAEGAPERIVENAGKAALTDAQLAGVLGVNECAIHRWKVDPAFVQALKKGKAQADKSVEDSLYVRAIGYTYDEVTVDEKNGTKTVTKHMAADPTAMIFWLKNRKPKQWRDRREVTGADGAPILEGVQITIVKGDSPAP